MYVGCTVLYLGFRSIYFIDSPVNIRRLPIALIVRFCLLPLHIFVPSSIIQISVSHAQVVAHSAQASLPQAVSQPPKSSSLAQVTPLNSQARQAFQLMLYSRTKFESWLEPDRRVEGLKEAEVAGGSRNEEDLI